MNKRGETDAGQPQLTDENAIIVVSGLPRSGTSLMMKMLEAGGLPAFTDNIRQANPDNPEGYYEFERVKALDKGDTAWLAEARGHAVKVISALLVHLPPAYSYRVIFMARNLDEVLQSQGRMLTHNQVADAPPDAERLRAVYAKHLQHVTRWLAQQPNFTVMTVDHHQLVTGDADASVAAIASFVQLPLDLAKMKQAINPALYRNRA